MKNLHIEAMEETPKVTYDAEQHTLHITGNSYPEDTLTFYAPIIEWLKTHLAQLGERPFTLNVEIIYINSSSSKAFMNLFRMLDEAAKSGKHVAVNWVYEEDDEDAFEEGEGFKLTTNSLEFHLVEKE